MNVAIFVGVSVNINTHVVPCVRMYVCCVQNRKIEATSTTIP